VIALKKLLLALVFAIAMFVMVEFSYRVYVLGLRAFDWRKLNSMTTLMRSQFVQLSPYPDIFFELKPDMQGWFKGKPFFTNSAGLADKEYQQEKPDEVFRVAVAGSSWTMPTGVELDDAWHSLLEDEFNSASQSRPVEFINFGVEMYGLREIVGTVRHKVPLWNPDLIMVAITTYTTSFIWEEIDPNQALPERHIPVLQPYAFGAIGEAFGWTGSRPADDKPRFEPDVFGPRLAQVQRAVAELEDISDATDVPIVIVFLGYWALGSDYEEPIDSQVVGSNVSVIYANRLFMDMPSRISYQVSQFDRHPNEAGHRLIAEFLAAEFRRRKLIPAD
jgi:hypothetical protein